MDFTILNILDEYTRQCLAIMVARKVTNHDVIDLLLELFVLRDIPAYVRISAQITVLSLRRKQSRSGLASWADDIVYGTRQLLG